jgi:hypothetical protein
VLRDLPQQHALLIANEVAEALVQPKVHWRELASAVRTWIGSVGTFEFALFPVAPRAPGKFASETNQGFDVVPYHHFVRPNAKHDYSSARLGVTIVIRSPMIEALTIGTALIRWIICSQGTVFIVEHYRSVSDLSDPVLQFSECIELPASGFPLVFVNPFLHAIVDSFGAEAASLTRLLAAAAGRPAIHAHAWLGVPERWMM